MEIGAGGEKRKTNMENIRNRTSSRGCLLEVFSVVPRESIISWRETEAGIRLKSSEIVLRKRS